MNNNVDAIWVLAEPTRRCALHKVRQNGVQHAVGISARRGGSYRGSAWLRHRYLYSQSG